MGNRGLCTCLAIIAIFVSNSTAKESKHSDKISFKLYRDHLVIAKGILGDIGNRNLLIDTGTNPTVVDEALAHDLGLRPVGRAAGGMSVVGGIVQTYYAMLKSLDLGPIHRESLPVAVANLSLMQAQTGVRIDAIVGLDALAPNNFQIDYESQKLKFGSFRIASPVPMIESAPLAIITTRLNGTAVNLAVDTGSSELVLFRDALPDSVGTLPTARTVQLSNVAGDVVAPIVRLQNFTVGDNQVSGQLAVLATVPQCCEFGGILGVSGLHIRKLSFDFQDRLVGIELFDDESAGSTSDGHCRPAFPGASCRNALLPPSNR